MIKIDWVNHKELKIITEEVMTPEAAYLNYPEYEKVLREFVNRTNTATNTCEQINKKVDEIFRRLNIKKHFRCEQEQKEEAFKLFQYIINSSRHDEKVEEEKAKDKSSGLSARDMQIKDIHRCLIEGRSVSSSDASALSLLLQRMGLETCQLTLKDKDPRTYLHPDKKPELHDIISVKFKDGEYYSDPAYLRDCLVDGDINKLSLRVSFFQPDNFMKTVYHNRKKVVDVYDTVEIDGKQTLGKRLSRLGKSFVQRLKGIKPKNLDNNFDNEKKW